MKENFQKLANAGNIQKIFINFLIIFLIIFLLFKFNVVEINSIYIILEKPIMLLLLFFLFFITFMMLTFRWKMFLEVQGIKYKFTFLLKIVCFGFFFNTILPGSVSGDLFRTLFIFNKSPNEKTAALSSIVFDRIIGVIGLFALSSLIIAANYRMISENDSLLYLSSIILSSFAAILIIGLFLLKSSNRLLKTDFIIQNKEKNRFYRYLYKILNVFSKYNSNTTTVAYCLGIAVLIHFVNLCIFLCVAYLIFKDNFSLINYSISMTYSLMINVLPITPGGIGLGEGSFDQICKLLFNNYQHIDFGSIFFIFRSISVIAIILSCVPFLIYWKNITRAD